MRGSDHTFIKAVDGPVFEFKPEGAGTSLPVVITTGF